MLIATELDKRTLALKAVLEECNEALFAQGAANAGDLSGVPEQIRGMQNLRVLRGSFTPEADSTSLTLPIPGFPKAVSFCQKEVTRVENQIMCAVYDPFNWKAIAGESKGVVIYRTPKMTAGSMTMPSYTALSAIEPVFDGESMTLPEISSSFYWVGGREHLWEAYYWGDYSNAVQKYSVTAEADAYLISLESGGYRLTLSGDGEARLTAERQNGNVEEISYSDPKPWDAYAEEIREIYVEGGITAIGKALFAKLSKAERFVNRSPALTEIGAFAFYRCFGLQSAEGLKTVQTVGDHAFQNCAALQQIDLDEARLQSAGLFATHMSSVEDAAPLSEWEAVSFGICANRALKWGDALAEIQSTKYTATKILPCPNPDMQTNYPDIDFCSGIIGNQHFFSTVDKGGCVGLSLYHAYNAVHGTDGKARESFRDFWENIVIDNAISSAQEFIDQGLIDPRLVYANGVDGADGYVEGVYVHEGKVYFRAKNFHGGTDTQEILGEMIRRISATEQHYGDPAWSVSQKLLTCGAEAKRLIDQSLQAGLPVLASVNHMGLNENSQYNEGDHEVCIIGCNRETDKLTVVDSTGAAGTKGHIYEVAYEDLFYSYEETPGQLRNSIRLLTIG